MDTEGIQMVNVVGSKYVQVFTGREESETRQKCNEEKLKKKVEKDGPVFVETRSYTQSRSILNDNNFVVIVGSCGEGKSTIANRLAVQEILKGYKLRSIKESSDWELIQSSENYVILIENAFEKKCCANWSSDCKELICGIKDHIESSKTSVSSLKIIMTIKPNILCKLRKLYKYESFFDKSNIVDLNKDGLTDDEKIQIFRKHNEYYEQTIFDDEMVKQICSHDTPCFPNCVHMFFTNRKIQDRGIGFFENPSPIVHSEIVSLYEKDKALYTFLVLLIIYDGEMHENFLERVIQSTSEDILLPLMGNREGLSLKWATDQLRQVVGRDEPMYLQREDGIIKLRYPCLAKAVCNFFGDIMPKESLKYLPFSFICEKISVEGCERREYDDFLILSPQQNKNLADRFLMELEKGNIKQVCQHRAFTSFGFVACFLDTLQTLKCEHPSRLKFILQITERENAYGALWNGSLLYWCSSVRAEKLFKHLLNKRIYNCLEDKCFLRIQASAAIVSACWYGYPKSVLEILIELGANINSALHVDRRRQTYNCDFCTLQDPQGTTVLQSAIYGDHTINHDVVELILSSGVKFREYAFKYRPLIFAVKKRDISLIKLLLPYRIDVNAVDTEGHSAMFYIVEGDYLDLAKLLLEESKVSLIPNNALLSIAKSRKMASFLIENGISSDKHFIDENGRNPLHHARNYEVAKYFIEIGCNINHIDQYGKPPLFYAKSVKMLNLLLEYDADRNIQDAKKRNIFHYTKNVEILQIMLKNMTSEQKLEMLNHEDENGKTPIFTAKNPDILDALLRSGSSVNHKGNKYRTSDSFSESLSHTTGTVQLIYSRECSYQQDLILHTELHSWEDVAKQLKKPSSVDATMSPQVDHELLSVASVGERTDKSETSSVNSDITECQSRYEHCQSSYNILMWLIMENKLDEYALSVLLKYKIEIMAKDSHHQTVLHYLFCPPQRIPNIETIFMNVLKYVEETSLKLFVNIQDRNGNTALHLACCCRSTSKLSEKQTLFMIETLIEKGADVSVSNNCKETPLHFLLRCKCCFVDAVRSVADRYNVNKVCARGWQPLQFLMSIISFKELFIRKAQAIIDILLQTGADIEYFMDDKHFFPTNSNPILLKYLLENYSTSNSMVSGMVEQCSHYKGNILGWANVAVINSRFPVNFNDFARRNRTHDDLISKQLIFKRCLQGIQNETLLHLILEFLFPTGCTDINLKDEEGNTVLLLSLRGNLIGHLCLFKIIKYLLERGADPNVSNLHGETVVEACILSKHSVDSVVTCLDLLVKYGANVNNAMIYIWIAKASKLRTPVLNYINKSVNPNVEKDLSNAFHHLVKSYATYGITDSLASITEFVKRGVDINYQDKDGNTPLHLALMMNAPKQVIIELLRNEAQTAISNYEGHTSFHFIFLHRAVSELDVFEQFLTYVKPEILADSVALHLLVSKMRPDTLKILVRFLKYPSCSINSKDSNKKTVLHNACTLNDNDELWCTSIRPHVVRLLLAKGVEINEVDFSGCTVLHHLVKQYYAIYSTNPERSKLKDLHSIISMTDSVIAYKIDTSVADKEGRTVTDYIHMYDLTDLKDLIKGNITPERLNEKTVDEILHNV